MPGLPSEGDSQEARGAARQLGGSRKSESAVHTSRCTPAREKAGMQTVT
jgi:hypothetical protein